ncbi:hypothetical protein ACIRON_14865 [Nocardioides sp. NPDC101246]|uniref:hypothetical protein n=1 Tax=Nocardioides sp. NPDC101246 TaxID=3364336 RepID=UPI0037F656DE
MNSEDVGQEVSGPRGGEDSRLGRGPRAVAGAVYGLVSIIAIIAGASHFDDSAGRVFAFAVVSSMVIWTVHIYATILAESGSEIAPWRSALVTSVRHEFGIVEGVFVPLVILLLGAIGWLEDERAINWSMWSGVVLLVLIPLFWLRRTGRSWAGSLVAAGACGLLGLGLTWMKVLLH